MSAAKYYDEDELMALVGVIGLINLYNRFNVITRQPAGDYQPGQFGWPGPPGTIGVLTSAPWPGPGAFRTGTRGVAATGLPATVGGRAVLDVLNDDRML